MGRLAVFTYGMVAYVLFLITFLYSIGFVGNIVVPKSIDSGVEEALGSALIINIILLGLFAVQHSVMARPAFKQWWTTIIPGAIERSTYVLLSSLVLALLFWQWRPMAGVTWSVENNVGSAILTGLFWVGWFIVLLSTFLINHFDLFGLRQIYINFQGKEYTSLEFRITSLYKYVRHPIMLGFIIAFWATPVMTAGHLLFAVVTTAYILIAIQFEERDLINFFSDTYKNYQRQVSMILPMKKKTRDETN